MPPYSACPMWVFHLMLSPSIAYSHKRAHTYQPMLAFPEPELNNRVWTRSIFARWPKGHVLLIPIACEMSTEKALEA
eukprot:scaffold132412_cov26-Tisochrysis_lutea.AAC.1